MKAVL
ncbi:Protein of unknown function [Bacillus cereus]